MIQVNSDIQEILAEIFSESERPDKMKIELDPVTRRLIVVYEDIDNEWYNDLIEVIS